MYGSGDKNTVGKTYQNIGSLMKPNRADAKAVLVHVTMVEDKAATGHVLVQLCTVLQRKGLMTDT